MAGSPPAASAAATSNSIAMWISSARNTAWKPKCLASNTIPSAPPARPAPIQGRRKTLHHRPRRACKVGAKLMSGPTAPPEIGNCLPARDHPRRSAHSQHRTYPRSRRPDGPHRRRRGHLDVARRGLRANPPALRRNPAGQQDLLRHHRPGRQRRARKRHPRQGRALPPSRHPRRSAAAWRATRWTIPTAAARASPRAAAAGSN